MSYARPYRRAGNRVLSGLGATDVSTPLPAPGRPQPPIWPLRVGNNGGFLAVRSSPAQGACGVSSYPCRHPGVDVAADQGTPVKAPESGVIVAVGGGDTAPFVGYGPWFVVIRGVDSGKFHMLGHLEPMTSGMGPINAQVVAGQVVGTVSNANHTHWEVRTKVSPDFAHGETNFTNNADPIEWLGSSSAFVALLLLGGAALLATLMWRNQ